MESVLSSSNSPLTQKKLSEQSVDDTALGKPEKPPTKAVHATPKKSIVVDRIALELETPEKLNLPPRVQNRNVGLSGQDVKKKSLSFHRQELDESDTDSSSEGELEDEERSSGGGGTHRLKSVEASDKLPEKFEMLCQFFCTMANLISLIRMRRKSPTLANISPELESVTGRKMSGSKICQIYSFIIPSEKTSFPVLRQVSSLLPTNFPFRQASLGKFKFHSLVKVEDTSSTHLITFLAEMPTTIFAYNL